jgi:hypothetical protein
MGAFDRLLAMLDKQAQADSPIAAEASVRALRLRLELGRIGDLEALGRRFATRFPRHVLLGEVAETMFFLAEELLERSKLDEAERGYREYLRRWITVAPDDRVLEAHVRLAELLLRGSCPVGGFFGACVRFRYVRGRCPAGAWVPAARWRGISDKEVDEASAKIRWAKATLVRRRPSLLGEARAHLGAANRLWERIRAAHPSDEARDFAAHAILLAAYPHLEYLLSLNDGLAHERDWQARIHHGSVAHSTALENAQKAAEAAVSPAGKNELRAHVALSQLLFSLPIDNALEAQFCHQVIHIEPPWGLPPPLDECLDAIKAPTWNQWNLACAALVEAHHFDSGRIYEVVPLLGYPPTPEAPPWSPPWGLLPAGLYRSEMMWFLESVHRQAELPFAWEHREGFPLPPPYPPMPKRRLAW